MDLIYADSNREDIGILHDYTFDLAYGVDENDFELTVTTDNNVCSDDYFVYIENTEYGGIVDSIEVNTEQKTIKYKGRTFHGILDKKIIMPNSGADYYTVSGDLNTIIAGLITRYSLSGLFKASTNKTINISSYNFNRYVSVYEGLRKMLASVNYKLALTFKDGFVELSAVPISVYGEDEGLDSDQVNFLIRKTYNPVNHLVCLGQGELRNRTVIHLYLNPSGQVVKTQYYTGLQEVVETYDEPNVESSDELEKRGKERLLKQNTSSVEVSLNNTYNFDIGDKITAYDVTTDISVQRTINKKVVTIKNDLLTIDYSVGE